MDQFTNIGKAVILQSLGLQKNHIEVIDDITEVIDYNNPNCISCKNCAIVNSFKPNTKAYDCAASICANCPHKKMTTQHSYQKVYHNETNKYGYKPVLKSNSIKLFILLHFYHPDKFGILKDINTSELASTLSCDEKTIYNNLSILSQYKYISFCKNSAHSVTVCILDYEKYYLTASKGGRGFIVMSITLLKALLKINNLMSLRIHLRKLLEFDNYNPEANLSAISTSYKDMKLSLPDYTKPCVIRDSLKNSSAIFNISFNETSVKFEIVDCYNSKQCKINCYNHYYNLFKSFIRELNRNIVYANTGNAYPEFLKDFFTHKDGLDDIITFKFIKLVDYEFDDLAQLAMQFSFDNVITALCTVYHHYYVKEQKVNNLGGLLRTIIISNINSSYEAA